MSGVSLSCFLGPRRRGSFQRAREGRRMTGRCWRSLGIGGGLLVALMLVGCGGKGSPLQKKIRAPELGLSLNVPRGWKVDGRNPRLCFKGRGTGLIMDEPLGDRGFDGYVDAMGREYGGRMVSRTPVKVGKYDGVRAIIEHPGQGSKEMALFILKGERVVLVSFVVPTEDFEKEKFSMGRALDSVTLD